jgi:putative hydrolase of the HAD superfamily
MPGGSAIEIIAFDADDTLWHNEAIFYATHEKCARLLAKYHSPEWIGQRLVETELRNLQRFGYGVKGFTLSMIETAIELSEGRVTGVEIQSIIEMGKEMIFAPIELLDGVRECVAALSASYELMIITKGDLFDQESKIARSGLGDFFSRVEVVREKDRPAYERTLRKHRIEPGRFLMVGNSVKSDILPVVALGARAVHIPYRTTWIHERITVSDEDRSRYIELGHISLLPRVVEEIERGPQTR